jgi:hypothetical protein
MVKMQKKSTDMPLPDSAVPALDEITELNRLFLEFLRGSPAPSARRFAVNARTHALLKAASGARLDQAAGFPRSLFCLRLPEAGVCDEAGFLAPMQLSGERVLKLYLLHGVRNLCRRSGYAARVTLGLDDRHVERLRKADAREIVLMSLADDLIRAAFVGADWIWESILTERGPASWRQLLLIGLQPNVPVEPISGFA